MHSLKRAMLLNNKQPMQQIHLDQQLLLDRLVVAILVVDIDFVFVSISFAA